MSQKNNLTYQESCLNMNDTTVTTDIGSHYIWMARHFRSYKPRHFLMLNGMQPLGVGLRGRL